MLSTSVRENETRRISGPLAVALNAPCLCFGREFAVADASLPRAFARDAFDPEP